MLAEHVIDTDVLVIGGGIAGNFAAIRAKEAGVNVTLVEKNYVGGWAPTAVARSFSVFNPEWGHDLDQWMSEIAKFGDYTNNPEWTEICLRESYDRFKDLVSWGVDFNRGEDGEPIRLHNRGVLENCTHGPGNPPLLRKQALRTGVKIVDRVMITDLIKQDGRIVGAVGFHTREGELYIFRAKATVICTGWGSLGISDSFERACAFDGEAIAYRAGASLSGKEFSQSGGYLTPFVTDGGSFYASGVQYGKVPVAGREVKIASPEVFGMLVGSYIQARFTGSPVPKNGEEGITPEAYPRASAPGEFVDAEGNVVSWVTMMAAVAAGRGPLLFSLDPGKPEDVELMERMAREQPNKESLLDPSRGGLYLGTRFELAIGSTCYGAGSGIWSANALGGTSLPGLYAAGDCYNSRANGAFYPLHGFGTRNAAVIGDRAGRSAARHAREMGTTEIDKAELCRLKGDVYAPLERVGGFDANWVNLQIKTLMTPYYTWIVRHGDRLKAALTFVEHLNRTVAPQMYCRPRDAHGLRKVHEAKGRLLSAEMMLRSALFRTESRGSHYREDYPRRDDPNWLAVVKITGSNGKMNLVKESFPEKWWPDLGLPYKERYTKMFLGEE